MAYSRKPIIAFFPTNGAGMGHLTRCLAYARRLADSADIFFFSQCSAVGVIEDMGFQAEYFISPLWSSNTSYCWNSELSVRVGGFLEQTRPDIIVFDGVWPYQGFMSGCRAYGRHLKIVWSHRGLLKDKSRNTHVDMSRFALTIRPGELGTVEKKDTEIHCGEFLVPPVTLLRDIEILSKVEARRELGLPLHNRIVIFSLGAGNINELRGIAQRLIGLFLDKGFLILWCCPKITTHDVELPPSVRPISVYPLVRYMRAFDFFVGAAGYNTCCEVSQTQIPSLIVPNTQSSDNQPARARLLAQYAPVVVSPCETDAEAAQAVGGLLGLARLHKPRACPVPMNGAELAAQAILRLAQE